MGDTIDTSKQAVIVRRQRRAGRASLRSTSATLRNDQSTNTDSTSRRRGVDEKGFTMSAVQRLDASESFWFARELESIKAQILVREIPSSRGRSLVPVASGVPAGSAVYVPGATRSARRLRQRFAKDRGWTSGRETSSPIRPIRASYGYTTGQHPPGPSDRSVPPAGWGRGRHARHRGQDRPDLPGGRRAAGHPGSVYARRRQHLRHPQRWRRFALWSTKTADEILADLQGFGHRASVVTNEVHPSDTIAMSIDQYNIIATKRINSASDRTVLEHFLATSPYIKQIVPWYACVGRGASASTPHGGVPP